MTKGKVDQEILHLATQKSAHIKCGQKLALRKNDRFGCKHKDHFWVPFRAAHYPFVLGPPQKRFSSLRPKRFVQFLRSDCNICLIFWAWLTLW